jgi:hypothetical protein
MRARLIRAIGTQRSERRVKNQSLDGFDNRGAGLEYNASANELAAVYLLIQPDSR